MTLDKAIELNIESQRSLRNHKFHDHADAVKLGNEALKLYQHNRLIGQHVDPITLPGETK